MKNILTLRQLCEKYHVTRRAVQGYEKIGLLKTSHKDSRGYLLYDFNDQQRVQKIKQFQQFGFQLKEIKDIIDAPNDILKKELENKVLELEQKQMDLKEVILEIHALIESL